MSLTDHVKGCYGNKELKSREEMWEVVFIFYIYIFDY